MSKHTTLSLTVPQVVATLAALTLLPLALVALAVMLFRHGDSTGDLAYTIGGVVMLICALPIFGGLIDVSRDAIDQYRRRK